MVQRETIKYLNKLLLELFQNKSLKKIIIPKSVIHIGFNVFKNFSSLKEIIILSKIVKIQFNAFDQCESLEKVIMPTSIFQPFYDYFLRRNILLINDSVENIISKYIKIIIL